jgi:hypothetical protein
VRLRKQAATNFVRARFQPCRNSLTRGAASVVVASAGVLAEAAEGGVSSEAHGLAGAFLIESAPIRNRT